MTSSNGSAEWHGSGEGGSGTLTVGDGIREWWTLVTVCVGTVMLLLDVTIVNVALPKIQAGLGSSFTDLQCCPHDELLRPCRSRAWRGPVSTA